MTSRGESRREDYNSCNCSDSVRGCCWCICLAIALLLLLIVASVLLLILLVKPKKPTFDLESVSLQNISARADPSQFAQAIGFSISIGLTFTATNDNKVGIKYETSTFKVMYRGFALGNAFMPGFYQPANSVRRITTAIYVNTATFGEAIANNLKIDALDNDRVEFTVLGDIHAQISVIRIHSPRIQVSVNCSIAISPKSQSLYYKRCGFDGFNV